jgi:YgiT-type zinc finger domain-containing protein
MSQSTRSQCPACGGKRKHGKTTFTAEFGSGVVVIRNVPATVCSQCGEDWIADDIAERLEAIVKEAKKSGRQVEVSEFPKKAG